MQRILFQTDRQVICAEEVLFLQTFRCPLAQGISLRFAVRIEPFTTKVNDEEKLNHRLVCAHHE